MTSKNPKRNVKTHFFEQVSHVYFAYEIQKTKYKSHTQSRKQWEVNRIFEFLNATKLTKKKQISLYFERKIHWNMTLYNAHSAFQMLNHSTLNTSYTIFHFHLMPPMFPFISFPFQSVSLVRTNCIESSVCLFQCACVWNS